MSSLYTIIDDFYSDPDTIRKMALEMPYFPVKESTKHLNKKAPWPGKISKDCYKPKDLDMRVSKALEKPIISTPVRAGISGFFRISKADDHPATFCHVDGVTEISKTQQYAGVLYLSPLNGLSGTLFYKHKASSLVVIKTIQDLKKVEIDFNNESAWELIDMVEMKYNRLVLYDADTVHSYGTLFGDTDDNARLTQIFVFNEVN